MHVFYEYAYQSLSVATSASISALRAFLIIIRIIWDCTDIWELRNELKYHPKCRRGQKKVSFVGCALSQPMAQYLCRQVLKIVTRWKVKL